MNLFGEDRHIHRSAEISDCGKYRWWLRRSWRLWGPGGEPLPGKGVCCFLMLNPSTADGLQDDPTIRRCIGFAKAWGFNVLSVRNLFPWRATDPSELLTADAPTGGHRGDTELLVSATADMLVAAWGAGVPFGREDEALRLLSTHFPAKEVFCLGTTKYGHPRHPLYVKADTQPILFRPTPPAQSPTPPPASPSRPDTASPLP